MRAAERSGESRGALSREVASRCRKTSESLTVLVRFD